MSKRFEKYSKLTLDDPKFIVNEEKKTVTCVLTGSFSLSDGISVCTNKSFLGKNNPIDTDVFKNLVFGNSYILGSSSNIRVIRTARCSKNDKFDIEKGKMIAKRKCKIVVYKELAKIMAFMYMKMSHIFAMESSRYSTALLREEESYRNDYL